MDKSRRVEEKKSKKATVKDEGELWVVSRVVGVSCEVSLPHPHYPLPDPLLTTHSHPLLSYFDTFLLPNEVR